MNISGKTPLMRAKKLEKYLGVEEIYLKLEGTNPFNHKFDRIAEVLVKDAQIQNKQTLLVNGAEDYIESVGHFAEKAGLSIKVPQFKNEKWKNTAFPKDIIIDFTKEKIDNKYVFVDTFCEKNDFYNASNGYRNRHLSIISLQSIGEEIAERLGDGISSVFTQLSYGYTVSSLYNGFVEQWVQGKINKYPQIFSCTIPNGNVIFDDFKKKREILGLENYKIKVNKYTRNLFTGEGALLEETLKAIHDTEGNIISVDEKLLKESSQVLRQQENIILSTEEAYAFAGFYKMAKEGQIEKGKHVIILNDGRSDLEVIRINDFKKYAKEELAQWIKEWLQGYSDPIEETIDALDHAIEDGFILLALRNNIPQGACVVVNTGFKDFVPTYHLGYIATKEGNKGRGIATNLISQMIELTDGNLSLHVDAKNKRATKLYEKLGFEIKYFRMLYTGE
ncbi:threonine synthase [Acetoanaerobium pronyense]|uniref:Threonine synthase n=1 Tax=Acetoanaerobium pronyense TaxID=1482736 RepID=A0ABS4KL00_9FIRM|nr:pyridoxal-phosphate dependent enzyme [Acetoanaerobium pronyense]MBP2028466.1 threonine synthase [Acetoanaerobium pronyense]